MPYVKTFDQLRKFKPRLLAIEGKTPVGKILPRIKKAKNADFVWVKKANPGQMAAVLFARLLGKKFVWVQNFKNPPTPNFFTRLLLNQSDHIFVSKKDDALKLKTIGIDKNKIKLQK